MSGSIVHTLAPCPCPCLHPCTSPRAPWSQLPPTKPNPLVSLRLLNPPTPNPNLSNLHETRHRCTTSKGRLLYSYNYLAVPTFYQPLSSLYNLTFSRRLSKFCLLSSRRKIHISARDYLAALSTHHHLDLDRSRLQPALNTTRLPIFLQSLIFIHIFVES